MVLGQFFVVYDLSFVVEGKADNSWFKANPSRFKAKSNPNPKNFARTLKQ